MNKRNGFSNECGFTLSNLLVTLGIIAILTGTAVSNIKQLDDPLADASFEVNHFLRLARARAISQTISVQIAPSGSSRIAASSAATCDDTMVPITDFFLDLPRGASLSATDWSVCFTARGLSPTNETFVIQDGGGGRTRTVEIALGGGARIQ